MILNFGCFRKCFIINNITTTSKLFLLLCSILCRSKFIFFIRILKKKLTLASLYWPGKEVQLGDS